MPVREAVKLGPEELNQMQLAQQRIRKEHLREDLMVATAAAGMPWGGTGAADLMDALQKD